MNVLIHNKIQNVFLALILYSVSMLATGNESTPTIEECHLEGITSLVTCGTLDVPANYKELNGDVLSINFAVLPAIDTTSNKVPLMFLAGGPGQAAVELAAHIRSNFTEIRKTRDIILIDQRGTGLSHPLQCDEDKSINHYSMIPEDFNEIEVKKCIKALQKKNDLSNFTSENAIRDFDAVRIALGYNKVNLYGGSYGTRAALIYMRMFPESLNSVVLDSVGPIEVPIGLFGQSAARSFELLMSNCRDLESCNNAYPNVEDEYKMVIERLSKGTIALQVPHPRLGTNTLFNLNKGKFISTLFTGLYSMQTRHLLPLVIHEAYKHNYQPLLGLIATSDSSMNVYVGLTFNIVCNEDMPRVSPKMKAFDIDNNFGKGHAQLGWDMACPLWPKYKVDNAFYEPITASIPTLILSGNLDPVTPPSNGDKSDKMLPNSHHIISNNNAHIVASSFCGVGIVNEFLEHLNPKDVDSSCLLDLPSESFMTSLNGSI